MDDAIQNQYEFFIQRFGGPDLYSKRKGHPALKGAKNIFKNCFIYFPWPSFFNVARHRDFHIDTKAADRWSKEIIA